MSRELKKIARKEKLRNFIIYIVLFCYIPVCSNAGSYVRDAEIESVIEEIAEPLIIASGIPKSSLRIFLINEPLMNAFVYGGMNIFLFTGMIEASETPEAIAGIIAHELGHIANGHILRGSDDRDQLIKMILTSVLLSTAAIIAGSEDASLAILMSGYHIAERNYLHHSRMKEKTADILALKYLTETNIGVRGLLKILSKFTPDELQYQDLNPYQQTHPLSMDRIHLIREEAEAEEKKSGIGFNESIRKRYRRALSKLKGYLDQPESTIKSIHYHHTMSTDDLYRLAIAKYRNHDIEEAKLYGKRLIEREPSNPYFYEFQGQIAFESGESELALQYFTKAENLTGKRNLLLSQELATVMSNASEKEINEMRRQRLINEAIMRYKSYRQSFPDDIFSVRQLAVLYGRLKQMDMVYAFMAEESLLKENKEDAKRYLNLAKKSNPGAEALDIIAGIELGI